MLVERRLISGHKHRQCIQSAGYNEEQQEEICNTEPRGRDSKNLYRGRKRESPLLTLIFFMIVGCGARIKGISIAQEPAGQTPREGRKCPLTAHART